MNQVEPRGRLDDTDPGGSRGLRRIVVTAGVVLIGLIVLLAAIYAGVFLILAPMMQ